MDSAIYRHIMGEKTKSWDLPHYSDPCHNLVSLETMLKVSKKKTENVDLEETDRFLGDFPFYKPSEYVVKCALVFYCGSEETDVGDELVKKKLLWEKELKRLSMKNTNQNLECLKKLKKNQKVKVSKGTKRLITLFENDPEPKFSGNYNWLCTGGNLEKVEVKDHTYLISADSVSQQNGFSILKLNETLDKVNSKSFTHLKSSFPILQISGKAKDENVVLFVRQRNKGTLFICKNDCDLKNVQSSWTKSSRESEIFTCVDVKDNLQEVLVSDTNKAIRVFDTETEKKTFGFQFRNLNGLWGCQDSWNQVLFGDLGLYVGLRNRLSVLDTRERNSKPKMTYLLSSSVVNECEEISSIFKSTCDPNYLYLSTTHSLLQIDLRNGETVQRWTHMMKNQPVFVQCAHNCDSDFILLQSHKIDEVIGITNDYIKTEDDEYYFSKSLPLLFESIKESLNVARLNGLCLNPYTAQRFDFSVTGAEHLKHGEDIHFFTRNGGGDIFLTKIQKSDGGLAKEDSSRESEVLNSMKLYDAHFDGFCTSEMDPHSVEWINLRTILKGSKNGVKPKKKRVKPEMPWKYNEMFSPESLGFYKDIVAQKVLKAWGVQTEESQLGEASMSSEDRILHWMQNL